MDMKLTFLPVLSDSNTLISQSNNYPHPLSLPDSQKVSLGTVVWPCLPCEWLVLTKQRDGNMFVGKE